MDCIGRDEEDIGVRKGWHLLMITDAQSIRLQCAIKNIEYVYIDNLPDQWYRYELQDILELSGRDHMALCAPNETASWLVWALGRGLRGRDNLFDRLGFDVTDLEALVWHKSDQIGVVVCWSNEHEVKKT